MPNKIREAGICDICHTSNRRSTPRGGRGAGQHAEGGPVPPWGNGKAGTTEIFCRPGLLAFRGGGYPPPSPYWRGPAWAVTSVRLPATLCMCLHEWFGSVTER